jgi:6-pyruvoyltetrahydropterin/6-carboxytetrahydropterin synthase
MSLAPFVTIRATVAGPVQPTGYIADVKLLDQAVRDASINLLIESTVSGTCTLTLTQTLFKAVTEQLPEPIELSRLELQTTPHQVLSVDRQGTAMTILTHQFEFSAAHRLHCEQLSDEENRNLFGKCNNPNGHGHNYVLDISVACPSSGTFDLHAFEATVKEHAVQPFDHKHLNVDLPDFANLNPTVENIASVVWDKLAPHLDTLHRVRVYETPKTWAEVTG